MQKKSEVLLFLLIPAAPGKKKAKKTPVILTSPTSWVV
jgi:hypothetical protein